MRSVLKPWGGIFDVRNKSHLIKNFIVQPHQNCEKSFGKLLQSSQKIIRKSVECQKRIIFVEIYQKD